MVFDFTTKSFRILLSAVPRCICPLAYGGPSWSTNFGAPARRARIFPYRSICDQRSSTTGSVVGKFAFIGKSVRGRLSVSFQSAMRDLVIVQKKTGAPPDGRPVFVSCALRSIFGPAYLLIVTWKDPWLSPNESSFTPRNSCPLAGAA